MPERWTIQRTIDLDTFEWNGWVLAMWSYKRIPDLLESALHGLCHGMGLAVRFVFRRPLNTCWVHYWANDLANKHSEIVQTIPLTEQQAAEYLLLHPEVAKRYTDDEED